jgi:hypothetical protein
MTRSVSVTLSGDEAIVLLDWLHRFNVGEGRCFEDQAEQRVLWNLEATLESMLVEPFAADYVALLADARARVRDPVE